MQVTLTTQVDFTTVPRMSTYTLSRLTLAARDACSSYRGASVIRTRGRTGRPSTDALRLERRWVRCLRGLA